MSERDYVDFKSDTLLTLCKKQRDLLEECERALASLTAWKAPVEITAPELGGLLNAMAHANDTLAKLRAQENADE